MQPYLRYAVRGLTKRPGKALFTIFMITVGVMLLTGTTLVLKNIPKVVKITYEEAHMADFALHLRMAPEDMVNRTCNEEKGVLEFDTRLIFRSTVYNSEGWPKSAEILLFGVRDPALNRFSIVRGRYFSGDEEAMIVEHDYGENSFGRSLPVETLAGNTTLEVVGTCRAIWMPRWYVSSTVYAIMPLKPLQRLLNWEGYVNMVLVKVKDQFSVKEVMENLSERLGPYGVISESSEGRVLPIAETESYYDYLVKLIFLIGLSLSAVGMTMVYSTLSLSISGELREIGTLKTLGATRGNIVLAYLLRGTLLGFIGSCLGSVLGVLVAWSLIQGFVSISLTFEGLVSASRFLIKVLLDNRLLTVLYVFLGTALSLLLALPAAWAASKVPAAQAVKSFPGLSVATGTKPWASRGPLLVKYALRSLARRKGREAAVILVIVISVSLNSTLVATSDSQQVMVNEYIESLNFDFIFCLSKPSNATAVEEALQPLVADMEFFDSGYFTQVKIMGYRLSTFGVPFNTSAFSYRIIEGRWLQTDNETVLPEHLAKKMGIGVGDRLMFSTEKACINATLVGLRYDPILNVAIISLHSAQVLENSSERINALVLKVKEGVDADQLANKVGKTIPNYLWRVKRSGAIEMITEALTTAFLSTASVMILFTWLTSIILIFSIVGQDVNEERRVIAILKALGLTPKSCVLMILFKLLIMGIFATGLCVLFSHVFLGLLTLLLARTTAFTAPMVIRQSLPGSLAFITATILPSGLILGAFAASTKISKTLRHE